MAPVNCCAADPPPAAAVPCSDPQARRVPEIPAVACGCSPAAPSAAAAAGDPGISFLEAPIHNGVDPKIPDNRPTAAPSMSILEDTRHPVAS
uniref:Uncharacterized protein n=1 Tax=Oryza brachyantha TaxID=4533 RepID=J3MFD5_ORYBR